MTNFTLESLQSAFKKPDNENNLPSNYYPFWKMKEGESCTVRFLPDANADNPFGFMVEKLMHNLEINGERKTVPCLKTYEEDCPICKVSSEYYNKEDKANGKKYWRKKQYITQAFIVSDPLDANEETGETHEGKIRFLTLGWQVYNVIKESFDAGDLKEIPFAYEGGYDFIIKKTKQGEYPSYSVGSKFVRDQSDLSAEQVELVGEGLKDLSELLPKHPGLEKVDGMLEAALTGGSYGNDDSGSTSTTKSSDAPAAAPKEEAKTEEVTDDDADDILEAIRARRQKKDAE